MINGDVDDVLVDLKYELDGSTLALQGYKRHGNYVEKEEGISKFGATAFCPGKVWFRKM